MAQTLHELLDELLRSAALTLEGQKTLRRYDYTINFDVLDGQSFHVEFIGGEADVQSGESEPKPILISHNIRDTRPLYETGLMVTYAIPTRYMTKNYIHKQLTPVSGILTTGLSSSFG